MWKGGRGGGRVSVGRGWKGGAVGGSWSHVSPWGMDLSKFKNGEPSLIPEERTAAEPGLGVARL